MESESTARDMLAAAPTNKHYDIGVGKKLAVSVRMNIQWLRPASVGKTIFGSASILLNIGSFFWLRATLVDEKGREIVRASGLFFQPKLAQLERMTRAQVPRELQSYLR